MVVNYTHVTQSLGGRKNINKRSGAEVGKTLLQTLDSKSQDAEAWEFWKCVPYPPSALSLIRCFVLRYIRCATSSIAHSLKNSPRFSIVRINSL